MDRDYTNEIRQTDQRRVVMEIPDVPFQVNEAINTLRGNIQLSGFDIKIIGVTSALATRASRRCPSAWPRALRRWAGARCIWTAISATARR